MKITKKQGYSNTDKILLKENNKELMISYEPNLDLYWTLFYDKKEEKNNKIKFEINKENYYVYSLIDNLYNNIKEYKIAEFLDSNKLKRYDKYNNRKLYNNDKVSWHCDDFQYNEGNILNIYPYEDKYILEFENIRNNLFDICSVRISNSGSRYNPFNILFMNMFLELQKYNPEEHQIHIEEYIYNKKKIKKLN